jgi:sulfonate transport system ATP-binding protein
MMSYELELESAALSGLAPLHALPRSVAKAPSPSETPRPASGATIRTEGLSKSYGERSVLRDVNLQIAPGEFVAIVGRSGCGKSTLLRLIAGLERADDGTIHFDGGARAAHSDEIRLMFQDARLLPWKRVLDNVALGLAPKDGNVRERARDALAQVGLADRAGDWPAVLSGGQRHRVALARALVHAPRLLLLDEPLGALDALTRIEMQRLIESLWQRHRFTALLVTHDVGEAVALADRVLLIESQQVALDEPITLARPRSHGQSGFARHEQSILDRVLRQPHSPRRNP